MAQGDEGALGAIYDRHAPVLYALAYQILKDRDDAEEAVLEAFTQAWSRSTTYERARGSVAAWLVVLARSRALDRVRARTSHQRALERASVGEPDSPSPAMGRPSPETSGRAEAGEQRARILSVLGQLSESQRVCIQLAYYDGLSQSEIAARLQEPLGTIKTRTRQAMLRLRDLLGGAGASA